MTPLRKKMIHAMHQRGMSIRTHQAYLAAVTRLARYFHRSPDKIRVEELQGFFDHLARDCNLSASSIRLCLNGIRFLYLQVLRWPAYDIEFVIPKLPQRIPELLTRGEVQRILQCCSNPKHRMLLELTYGCGLRVSEVVNLKVRDIDGERCLLRVVQAKGAKDRLVTLSPSLLSSLRRYWALCHPDDWLFPSSHEHKTHVSASCAQRIYRKAKTRAGIAKSGGIHGLRHAYATHQLEGGLAIHELQRLLGHGSLQSTQRYIHWLPDHQRANRGHVDLIANLGGQS